MHVCFHGGGGGDRRVAKSISIIRGLTKSMKAMSLKVKVGGGGGGNHARARRRRRPVADNQRQDCKDVAAAAASASAKIAPAQLQEEADHDHQQHNEEEEEEEEGGGKKQEYCDKCRSPLLDDGDGDDGGANEAAAAMVTAEMDAEESSREWVAEPEPGVVMTLAPRLDGTNRLRRMRFREALFDAGAAQSWWADSYDGVVELYSVVQSDDEEDEAAAAAVPVTPCQSEEEELPGGMTGAEESGSPSTSNFSGGPSSGSGAGSAGTAGSPILGLVTAPNTSGNGSTTTTTTTSRAAQHDSIGDQPTTPWREWIEEYEAGVFITVRAYPGHHLQLRSVELSRERFGEVKARVWWQENKARLHHLYSF